MAEFVFSAAANTVRTLATEYMSSYLSYFFGYGRIAEDFKNQRNELKSKEDGVKKEVDVAVRQAEIIEEDVENWLTRVEKELRETQILEDEMDRIQCLEWCPNWGWNYSLSKKLEEKTLILSKLVETCNFSRVGRRAPLQGIEFITSKNFIDSESSKSAFKEIMEAVNAEDVNMIGLYGMPGVGKTTLAEEVGKQALKQNLFDKVVMFTMSQNPNISKIQDKVADMIGLNFKTTSEAGKAEEILKSMKGMKNILVIVDDLWKEFKLDTIGIPVGEGCKILLTTRDQKVCIKMNCQKQIQLRGLSDEEGWDLFKANAGLEDGYSTLNDVAKEVAGECKGLPLAIVTVAKALKGESLEAWKAANRRLKDSRHLDNEDVFGGVYRLLELSYDYLKKNNSQTRENDIQSCFLLCSLFPEDDEISIEMLIMFGIGAGLFSDASSIEDKGREIGVALTKLQKSGLLLEVEDTHEIVRMHDVVRDFAHWLTSKRGERFMVKDGVKEWHDVIESFGCYTYTAIALWNCSCLNHFPKTVEFPKLKTLILDGKGSGQDLSTDFEEMKALQVLLLKNVCFSLEGLQSLTNLRTLRFEKCKLENISSLRNMRRLEILALIDTNIHEIPEELAELSTLKLLYLDRDFYFPRKMLSRLTSLQELQVLGKNNIKLVELNSLSRLTALSLRVSTGHCFPKHFIFPKLERYYITVNCGTAWWWGTIFRTLTIEDLSSSLGEFVNLFYNVDYLTLEKVNGLTCLPLIKSWEEKKTPLFSDLRVLGLRSLPDLESIWELEPSCHATASLQNLKVVRIDNCHKLKEIFSPSLAQATLHLEELHISSCDGLEQVFGFSQEEITENRYPLCCPRLKTVKMSNCQRLKYVFPANTLSQGLPPLVSVELRNCPQLIQVFRPREERDIICHPILLNLPFLRELQVEDCPKLECFVVQSQREEILYFGNVMNLCLLCSTDVGNHEEVYRVHDRYSFSSMEKLQLVNLSKEQIIWKDLPGVVTLETLTTLRLYGCKKLRYIFTPSTARSLSQLAYIYISRNVRNWKESF